MLQGIKPFEKNLSTAELPTVELPTVDLNAAEHSLRRSFSCEEMTDNSFWKSRTCYEAEETNSSSSRVFLEQFRGIQPENMQLSAVKTYCEKIAQFIPLQEIESYGYTNPSLACVFDKIGFSFAFLPEVQDILVKYLGEFKGFAPIIPIESSREQIVQACYELLQVVDANLDRIHEESLKHLWMAICSEKNLGDDYLLLSASQIQEYLQQPASSWLRNSVTFIDLRGSTIQILPPEIAAFTNLQTLYLDGSQIQEIPRVVLNKGIQISIYENTFWRHSDTTTWKSLLSNSDISSSSEETVLEAIWSEITEEHKDLPELSTDEEILEWLENPMNSKRIAAISSLNLSNLGLTELPDVIEKFTNLYELNLSNNWLENLPETIANLTNLVELNLSENGFKNIPPVIEKMGKLVTLDMHNNQLESLPDWIFTCKNIRNLYLQENKISSISNEIENLECLEALLIEHNQLTELPASIGNLSRLLILYIDNNPLQSIPHELYSLELREFICDRDLYATISENALIREAYLDPNTMENVNEDVEMEVYNDDNEMEFD